VDCNIDGNRTTTITATTTSDKLTRTPATTREHIIQGGAHGIIVVYDVTDKDLVHGVVATCAYNHHSACFLVVVVVVLLVLGFHYHPCSNVCGCGLE
jgi:hypothetical protein